MKLKLIKYHPLFAYDVGDVFEVNKGDTKNLLDGGYAVEVKGDSKKDEAKAKQEAEDAEILKQLEAEEKAGKKK